MAIKDLFVRLLVEKKQFAKGLDEAGDELKDFGKSADDAGQKTSMLGGSLERYLGPAALMGITAKIGKAAWELGELGARADAVSFKLTAFAGGADEAAKFTEAVYQASNRTVDSMTAMGTASAFLQMGIADTEEEMRLYVEGATRLGDQTQSAGQRIDAMTQLLKNLNVNMLDNFGLSKQVVMGRTEELQVMQGLTREEAMLVAIQEELTRQLGVLGPQTDTNAAAFDQLDAAVADLKMAAGDLAAPAVGELARVLATLAQAASGNIQPLQELSDGWTGLTSAMKFGVPTLVNFLDKFGLLDDVGRATGSIIGETSEEMDGWMQAMHGLPDAAVQATASIEEMAQAAADIEPIEMSLGIQEGAEAELLAALNASEIGAVAGGQLLEGLDAALQKTDAIGMLARVLGRQVSQQLAAFRDIGRQAWGPIEQGFTSAMQNVNFLQQIAAAVSPYVAAQMASDQTYGGEY